MFWPYYDRLNATEAPAGRDSGAFAKDGLKRHAAVLGLDGPGFTSCLDSARYAERVQAETAAGAARDGGGCEDARCRAYRDR
jgi:hypothetical protein